MREVYLDYNATTPLHPDVFKAMQASIGLFGNASSAHRFGQRARKSIDDARKNLADYLGCAPEEIIFTSGGSESNNLVLKGVTCDGMVCNLLGSRTSKHIITTSIEHPSIINTAKCLKSPEYSFSFLDVDKYGTVDPDDVRRAVTDNTVLISVMTGNNEVGTIQPIAEIGKIAREKGVFFHTDAVQAVGKVPFDVEAMNIDFLSLSGHKFYGPKGIGALYVRKDVSVCPLVHGGHQERGMRGGTENTMGIVGLGKAIALAAEEMDEENGRVRALRDRLWEGMRESIDDIRLNGHPENRLPGTLNVSFKFIDGESILFRLEGLGVAVSTGSACSSGTLEPSYVLSSMGITPEDAQGSIRFSLGRENSDEDVDYILEHLPGVIGSLREISPLYQGTGS